MKKKKLIIIGTSVLALVAMSAIFFNASRFSMFSRAITNGTNITVEIYVNNKADCIIYDNNRKIKDLNIRNRHASHVITNASIGKHAIKVNCHSSTGSASRTSYETVKGNSIKLQTLRYATLEKYGNNLIQFSLKTSVDGLTLNHIKKNVIPKLRNYPFRENAKEVSFAHVYDNSCRVSINENVSFSKMTLVNIGDVVHDASTTFQKSNSNAELTLGIGQLRNIKTNTGLNNVYVQCSYGGTLTSKKIYNLKLQDFTAQDNQAPIMSNIKPSGTLPAGTNSIVLSLVTNEPASCRFAMGDASFYNMKQMTSDSRGFNHQILRTGNFVNGATYRRFFRCKDTAGNTNKTSSFVTFTIAEASAKKEFRCQITTKHCGHNGGRFGAYLQASSQSQAQESCKKLASQHSYPLCTVSSEELSGNNKRYRCQLAKKFCGHNGGRYGVYVWAKNATEARRSCMIRSKSASDRLCQVQDGI